MFKIPLLLINFQTSFPRKAYGAGLAQLIIEGQQDDGVEPAKESLHYQSLRSLLEKKGHTKEEINEAFRHVPDPTGILDLN
ncbi:hypothetical protein ACFX12_030073 [Malus domestica]